MKDALWKIKFALINSKVYYIFRNYIPNHTYKIKRVNFKSDLLIEGFPRSANTYLLHGIKILSKKNLNIASHLHNFSHVRESLKMDIKTIIIYREPADCIASYIIKFNIKPTYWNIKILAKAYIKFYKEILAFKGLSNLMFISFEEITKNPEKCFIKIEKFLSTIFYKYDDTIDQKIKKKVIQKKLSANSNPSNFENEIALPNDSKKKIKYKIQKLIIKNKSYIRASKLYKLIKNEKEKE